MEWIEATEIEPKNKEEVLLKLDNEGYTYPHYDRKKNGVSWSVDILSLQEDCEKIGIRVSEIFPRRTTLF